MFDLFVRYGLAVFMFLNRKSARESFMRNDSFFQRSLIELETTKIDEIPFIAEFRTTFEAILPFGVQLNAFLC